MKRPRTVLPLPRYVERKPLKSGGHGYYFNPPSWARKAGCPVKSEISGRTTTPRCSAPKLYCCRRSTLGAPAVLPIT